MIQVSNEQQVVSDEKLRKAIIEDINGVENLKRKAESFRRHQCMKDQTKVYVIEELMKQFDPETVREMNYSLANVSFGRKIIDKLARVYSNGCQRRADPEAAQEQLDNLVKEMAFNKTMKTVNRYLRAHRNTIAGVVPVRNTSSVEPEYRLKLMAFQPHLYDIIEDPEDRESPMWVILSHYRANAAPAVSMNPAKEGRGLTTIQKPRVGDGKDQLIADKKEDENASEDEYYIWWSKHYHFTTNQRGEFVPMGHELQPGVVTMDDILNPIQHLPWVNFAIEQEGSFWAEGGSDIFDGAVRLNSMITNTDHIGVTQGYGQFYMKGKNLPRFIKAGVNKSILLEYEKDDPVPDIGFASSSPKLQELKEQIVMYVALLLTTNNLSTRSVQTQLGSGESVASGISLIIDKAESIEDVQDQRDIFQDNEPELWKILQKWQTVYKDQLDEPFRVNMLPDGIDVDLKFNDARPIMSEKEKLEVIEMRQKLGINRAVELLILDDQSLTEKEAEEKLMAITLEKIKNSMSSLNNEPDEDDQDEDEEIEEGDDDGQDQGDRGDRELQ
jgi:hypothetical protein